MKYWTKSWNPVTGCEPVSPGCDHCWAQAMARRFPHIHGDKRFDIGRCHDRPLPAWAPGQVVATCWIGDLFWEGVRAADVRDVYTVMAAHPEYAFLLLTKRPERMAMIYAWLTESYPEWALGHVWHGVSICTAGELEKLRPLRRMTGARLWVSAEPLLGPLAGLHPGLLDAVVVGGETGPGARPMDALWVSEIKVLCDYAGTPFVFKQWGTRPRLGGVTPERRASIEAARALPWLRGGTDAD